MHLSPREIDHLLLHQVGCLAQKRLARGVRLNYPEAVGLIATVVLEWIRDGATVADLMVRGQQILGRRQVMAGIGELVGEVQVEGTFPDGTKLVTIHHPIQGENGNLAYALYGSFLPIPDVAIFSAVIPEHPGAYDLAADEIELNAKRPVTRLQVMNTADRPIQVGSHYHFGETNPYLLCDRRRAYGQRLDIPAGTAVRFEPGECKTVNLVPIAGDQIIRGGNALADGPINEANRERFMQRVIEQQFAHRAEA